jgi:hypothetical protein
MKKFATIMIALLVVIGLSGSALATPDNGTSLTISGVSVVGVACNPDGSGGTATISVTLTSSGAVSPATILWDVTGADSFYASGLGTVVEDGISPDGPWSGEGRVKTVTTTFEVGPFPNGTYEITIYASQSGEGNENKTAVPIDAELTIDCQATNTCDQGNIGFFGEVVGNKNICTVGATINIQFKGDFGSSAEVTIAGPGGYSTSITAERAGESCVYHGKWYPSSGLTGGAYTFSVGSITVVTDTLTCSVKPGKK